MCLNVIVVLNETCLSSVDFTHLSFIYLLLKGAHSELICLFLPEAQKLPYYASYSHVRQMIHTLCTSHYLDIFITFIICLNVVTMSLEHYSQPHVR